MDRRVYILPIVSVFIALAFMMRPATTGLITAETPEKSVLADISVTINSDGLIPEDSVITVYLDDRSASMPFGEFVEKTGEGKTLINERIPEIDYDGPGYAGVYTYILPISEFGIDTVLESGEHSLVIEITYDDSMLSRDEQKIEI